VRRTENAAQDAVNARTFFGRNFNHPDTNGAFQYFKCGQTHILSKDDAIAKKWKEPLESDPVILLRFAHIQSESLLLSNGTVTCCCHCTQLAGLMVDNAVFFSYRSLSRN